MNKIYTMKKQVLLLTSALFTVGLTIAQDYKPCSTAEKNQVIFDRDPQLRKDYERLFLNGMEKDNDTVVFTIPVVFHILHQYGSENITDAQVYDQMEILNDDYRALNADLVDVVPDFDTVFGDVRIEFKLASYDPFGNCTNGIEHIYTHETGQGDDFSKMQQWNRTRYLNIWVLDGINSGAAGYAYYPTATNNQSFWIDGINILNNHIGSIGSGSAFNSRSLTHEIGHWLGLPHTWGSTNDNNLPINCDYDDGIADTPVCIGSPTGVCNLNSNTCDDTEDPNDWSAYDYDVVDNVQNFMDYSYCSVMFTKGQIAVMREFLQGVDGFRSNLITAETHAVTGIDLTTPPVCIPIPDFNASTRHTCVGETVDFTDFSYNGPVTFREWTFQDGTPATSTDANPSVSFNSFGLKTVTLTVGNASGSETKTFTQYISVSNPWADVVGPQLLDINSNHADWFRVDNPEENEGKFHLVNGVGKDNSRCFKLNTYKDVSDAVLFSDDFFYYNRLGGTVDALITPSFDLRTSTGVQFSFDYSYATNATSTAQATESIRVWYSRDCGENWVSLGAPITGGNIVTAGYAGNTDFAPAGNQDWETSTRVFPVSATLDDNTRFKIEFTASDLSSNLYLDNIFISGVLGTPGDFASEHNLVIAPNPLVSGSDLKIEYTAGSEPVTFTLRNIQGQELTTITRTETNQAVSFSMDIEDNLSADRKSVV